MRTEREVREDIETIKENYPPDPNADNENIEDWVRSQLAKLDCELRDIKQAAAEGRKE